MQKGDSLPLLTCKHCFFDDVLVESSRWDLKSGRGGIPYQCIQLNCVNCGKSQRKYIKKEVDEE